MKANVKKLDNNKRELSIEVGGDIVKNKFSAVYEKIAKEAKIPGFRPGNAPADIIEKHHPGLAHEQVLKELIPEVYDEAIKQENIYAIDLPEIQEVNLKPDLLTFKATVDVRPEIKIKDYKGIKINYKKIAVSDEDIQKSIDNLKVSRKIDNIDDAFVRGLGYPSLAELREAIRYQIYLQQENNQRTAMEEEIVSYLLKEHSFDLPKVLIERQLKELLSHTKVDLAMRGVTKEQIQAEEKNIEERLRPDAERQVRIYLVLEEIARKENIAIDDHMPHHAMEMLLREASWNIQSNQ